LEGCDSGHEFGARGEPTDGVVSEGLRRSVCGGEGLESATRNGVDDVTCVHVLSMVESNVMSRESPFHHHLSCSHSIFSSIQHEVPS
jgi:hypothetical protein